MYYRKVYQSFIELKQAVTDYIFYYNNTDKNKIDWHEPG
ncbi:hypothetical protein D4T97_013165 [Siminovitchia acidinfaciens]|uniref:Integrase catalytic domain-containing protein n=1 Tax=Siminovitchia acidinfaciens TaxID=2321395 RepID=A0A429XYL2_9BACI|nr:hypothetical protein D4T97_013165 [Siminovitchia acidinfaciens]